MIRGGGALLVAALAIGCGGSSADSGIGVSSGARPGRPVELPLRSAEGQTLDVAELRGQRVVLFLFATFDGVSQAALQPLSRFVRHHRDVVVLGVAVQPDAGPLVDAWVAALDPPFVVTFDPAGVIAEGTSDLGELEAIPTFVVLDAGGVERDRHVGFASLRKLESMLERAGVAR